MLDPGVIGMKPCELNWWASHTAASCAGSVCGSPVPIPGLSAPAVLMPTLMRVNNPADAFAAARLSSFTALASRTIDPGATQPRRSRTTEPQSLCLDSRSSNTVQVSRLVAA